MFKNLLISTLSILILSISIVYLIPNNEQTIETVNYDEIICNGSREENKIYLTFDDGYPFKNTKAIVQTLKSKNVPATFFIEGDFLGNHQPLINEILDDGHIIGCHTIDHNDVTIESDESFNKNLTKFEKLYYDLTNQELVKFFRPPMGRINQAKLDILSSRGYLVFMWDVNYKDYDPYNELGSDYAYKYILSHTKNGSIILLHTLTKSNVEALPSIIDGLREKGFVFSTLYDFVY